MKEITAALLIVWGVCVGAEAQDQPFTRQTLRYADTLDLDVFIPKTTAGDKRPLLIYVHGGGFSGGKRDLPNHVSFCEYFAKRGWITATISYHLTMKGRSFSCDQPVENKIATIEEAARNVNQAAAYLMQAVQTSDLINPEKVVIAGSSAGAEAVIHSAYWKKTQKEVLPDGFQYGGVISMAGALLDENWITAESAIPTALFHGTCDNLVPYATAPHHYCKPGDPGFMMLFGSQAIAERLQRLQKSVYLVTDCGGGHEWNEKPIRMPYIHMIEDFLRFDVLEETQRTTHLVYREGKHTCSRGGQACER